MTDSLPVPQTLSLAEQLDRCEIELAAAQLDELNARQAWELAEAKSMAALRARLEADGAPRRSVREIEAEIIIMRSDIGHEVGQVWLVFNDARARFLRLRAQYRVLSRAHWREVRTW